jgi:peroxiredoxin
MIVEDGTITTLNMEDGGGLTISSAESILEAL